MYPTKTDGVITGYTKWPNDQTDIKFSAQELIDFEAAQAVKLDSANAKTVLTDALDALTYDFGDGRIIQTRPKDESNIRNAIEILTTNGISSINWIMMDNIKYSVSADDLQTALNVSQRAALDIWNDYNP